MKTSETVYLSSSNNNISGFAPFTLTVVSSSLPISNKIYKIEYDFGDGNKNIQLLKPSSIEENPADVIQTHTYILTSNFIRDFLVNADVYQFNKSSYDRFSFIVSLSAPSLEELSSPNSSYYFKELHLIGSRMFGPDNDMLYMFEGIDPNCFIPVVVNWKQKPTEPVVQTIKDFYRPYRLLAPFENEEVTSINTGTNIVTWTGPDAEPNPDNPEDFTIYNAPLQEESLAYFDILGPENISDESKLYLNDFIYQLKANNMWDSLAEAWLLNGEYNLGAGTTAVALKNQTNQGTLLGNILPTWEDDGIRFYEGYTRPNFNVSRMEVQNWTVPPLRAPMSIVCVYSPFSSPKPSGNPTLGPGACLFGQTSLGGGGYQHFGLNYGFLLSAVDCYYGSNTIQGNSFFNNITGSSSGPYYMSTMAAVSSGPAYFYTNNATKLITSNYTSNATLSAIAFSYPLNGGLLNHEFDGIISAGFVFSSAIDHTIFYNIYKNTIGKNLNFANYP